MISSEKEVIAGLIFGAILIVGLIIVAAGSGAFETKAPEVAEVVEEMPAPEDPFSENPLIQWSKSDFLDSFDRKQLSSSKWLAKLKDLPDTEDSAKCLIRFFNASVADPELVKKSEKGKALQFDVASGTIGAAPSVTAELPEKILKIIQLNSAPLTFQFLEAVSLERPLEGYEIPSNIHEHIRNTAGELLLRDEHNLSPVDTAQLSFRHKMGDPQKLLEAIPLQENPEEELSLLMRLMQELINSPPSSESFLLGSDGGTGSLNKYTKEAGQIAILNRVARLDTESANQYLFDVMVKKNNDNKRYILSTSTQSEILNLLIQKDERPAVVSQLADIIAELRLLNPGARPEVPSGLGAVQFQSDDLGPKLRKQLLEKHWAQESIQQDRLLDLIPFQHAASFLAIKYLYSQPTVTQEVRNVIESVIAKNALHTSGIAVGWIPASPELNDPKRSYISSQNRMLLGETSKKPPIPRGQQLYMTIGQQPRVESWLHDENLLKVIVKRLKGANLQRIILLDIVGSTMHPLARKAFQEEVDTYAEVGPDAFAGQPVSLAISQHEVAKSLRVINPDDRKSASHHGWGDPWSIIALKSPKRIRPPKVDPDRGKLNSRSRLSQSRNQGADRKRQPSPREVQQSWFNALRDVIEAWHERYSLAISKMAPGVPELKGVSEKFSLEFPEGVHIRRQAFWDSNENSRGIASLPEGHRIGFIEFDTREHPTKAKQLFEEIYPAELKFGDEGWTDITTVEDGLERNIDILYTEENGLTKGSFLILERQVQ